MGIGGVIKIMVWEMLAAVIVGGFLVLLGVVAGGIFVYRTKRDSHEPLFARKVEMEDGPVNIDPLSDLNEDDEVDEARNVHEEHTRRFMEQAGLSKVVFAGDEKK